MRRLLAIGLAITAAAAAPPAHAATVALDRPCYLARQPGLESGQLIGFRGTGFAPGATVGASLDGVPVTSAAASAAGEVTGSFSAPALPRGRFTGRPTLALSDGASTATASFPVSLLAVDFRPANGNPLTLRVRFSVYGFGPVLAALGRGASAPVYEHVISPSGKRRATYYAGRTRGPCGSLVTSRRRILPFPAGDGRWRFVFTASRRYSARSAPLASVGFLVRTVFRPA